MSVAYFKIPYENVFNYLSNNTSDSDLDALYNKYDIESTLDKQLQLEQLSNIISDDDIYELGYKDEITESEQSNFEYEFNDTEDIEQYLATEIDENTLGKLMTQFDCYSLDNLALALTDDELIQLGYKQHNIEDENTIDIHDEYTHDIDYNEDLDYLEDIPLSIKYVIVDPENGVFAVKSEQDYHEFMEHLDPVLVDDCCLIEDCNDYDGILFRVQPHKFQVSEEVILNQELNTNIFDSNNTMLPDVKEQIQKYVDDFAMKMSNQGIDVNYTDICLVGSNAGYLYTPESDIDIHLMSAQQLSPETAEKLFNEFDIYEAENPLFIGDNKVELGIEDGYDVIANTKNARRYSIVDDIWVDDSDKNELYTEDDLSSVAGYEDIVETYTNKINKAVDNDEYAIASALKSEIRQNRSEDLANIGSLSMGNVVFKELRNNGAYGKLREYLQSKDLEVSLGNE